MIKHNTMKVITLHAYDNQGEVVDKEVIETNLHAELVYLNFEEQARRLYNTFRITMEVAFIWLVIIFLSSAFVCPAEAHLDPYGSRIKTCGHMFNVRNYWPWYYTGLQCRTSVSPFEKQNETLIGLVYCRLVFDLRFTSCYTL